MAQRAAGSGNRELAGRTRKARGRLYAGCRLLHKADFAGGALRAHIFARISTAGERNNGIWGLKIGAQGLEAAKIDEKRVATGVERSKTAWERQKTAKMAPQTRKIALRTLAEAQPRQIPGFGLRRAKNRPKLTRNRENRD